MEKIIKKLIIWSFPLFFLSLQLETETVWMNEWKMNTNIRGVYDQRKRIYRTLTKPPPQPSPVSQRTNFPTKEAYSPQ